MAVKKLETSECGCTRFTLDCGTAAELWSAALTASITGQWFTAQCKFDLYMMHKRQKTRPVVRVATV